MATIILSTEHELTPGTRALLRQQLRRQFDPDEHRVVFVEGFSVTVIADHEDDEELAVVDLPNLPERPPYIPMPSFRWTRWDSFFFLGIMVLVLIALSVVPQAWQFHVGLAFGMVAMMVQRILRG